MRLTTVILFFAVLNVNATSYAQRITLNEKNAQLEQIFDKISAQSGYDFFIADKLLRKAKPVNVLLTNVELSSALELIFRDQPFEFRVEDKSVLITEKPQSLLDKFISVFKEIDVKGKVTGEGGETLIGAVVAVKGTKRSVATNANGEFLLSGVEENARLVISYIGYEMKEVRASENFLSINLIRKTSNLEEVSISTGYQRIKKDQLTGAATTIGEKDYHQREAITGDFLESLEGKVPGLVYNGQTGELSIRGVSTFDAVKQPLIVLDGFPTEIDLRTINPNDIVSISVLRDAAAASIYGVRASNGVIVVETKRGKSGNSVFNFNSSLAIQERPDFSYLNYISASEYVQLQKNKFYRSNPSSLLYDLGYYKMNPAEEILFKGPRVGVANPQLTQQQVDQQLVDLGSYDNLNDYQNLFYRQRLSKNVNFDVSGGNDISTYLIGFNYIGETLVNKGSGNNQYNLNIANTVKLSKWLNLDFRGTYTNRTNKSASTPGYGDFLPYERLVDGNGNSLPVALGPGRDFIITAVTPANNNALIAAGLYDLLYNPYRELSSNSNTIKTQSLRFQGRLNGKITDWLNFDVGGNYENQNAVTDQLQTDNAFLVRRLINSMALRDPSSGKALFTNMPKGSILRKNSQKTLNYTVRGQLNFKHDTQNNDHSLSGMLGVEQKKITNDRYLTSFFGYDSQSLIVKPINMSALNGTVTPAFVLSDLGTSATFNSSDYFNETSIDRRFMSYYGQGTYIYKSKYIATGSFRIDQSNLFGVDPMYKNKPLWSAGLNWRLSEEDFVKKITWIDQLQLRAATGFNGNVPSSSNGAFLILSTALNTSLRAPLIYNDVLAPENQSLRWETTKNYNLGLDFSLIKSRISGSVDWYIKKTIDVFGQFDADPTTGFNQYNANTATIQNKGLELLLNSINFKANKFSWSTQLTASFNNNKVLAVKSTEFSNSRAIVSNTSPTVGLPIGSLYSYNYGGLTSLGQPYVLDRNGNQKILSLNSFGTAIVDVTKDDLIYSGTTTPKYVLGLNNQFSLGAFDFSFLFMYYGGHVMRVEQPDPNASLPLQGAAGFWKAPGDESNTVIPALPLANSTSPGYYPTTALYGYQYAQQFVRKADYIRLRDIIITFHPKVRFLDEIGLKNNQLRFQAQNVFKYTFSGNDIDPDAINRITGARILEIQPLYSLTLSTNF